MADRLKTAIVLLADNLKDTKCTILGAWQVNFIAMLSYALVQPKTSLDRARAAGFAVLTHQNYQRLVYETHQILRLGTL